MAAIRTVLIGAARQRRRAHFVRDVFSVPPRLHQPGRDNEYSST
ncbi:hypothetical protein PV408_19430 [Streptomyces sp. ME18-1-4]|nr:hypothetical protein [Streptomyces sp. ME18-1-4]MDX3243931.1 hypothetical protein [Streptomyces sp. ME18-1-4]